MKLSELKKNTTRSPVIFVFFVAVFFVSVKSGFAIPFAEYRQNVANVKSLLGSLENLKQQSSGANQAQAERSTVQAIRQKLPPRERVEFGNLTIETDNAWLEKDLQAYEKLAPNAPERAALLRQMTGRVSALESRLNELGAAQQDSARGKNEDKQKLDEILRRAEFQKTSEREKSVLERWWESFRQWWRNLFKREDKPAEIDAAPATDYSAFAGILRYGVLVLAAAIIVFVVWRFALPLMRLDRKAKKRSKPEPRVILGETLKADETAASLFEQAERLALQGDIRAAIRKGYIASLCELSDRKIIGLARHKTNRDYLRDLQKRHEVFQPMRQMTGSFERHWYGGVPAADEDWSSFRGNYREAVQNSK